MICYFTNQRLQIDLLAKVYGQATWNVRLQMIAIYKRWICVQGTGFFAPFIININSTQTIYQHLYPNQMSQA